MAEYILYLPPDELMVEAKRHRIRELSLVCLAQAIEELIYPGRHMDVCGAYNSLAEAFFASDLWWVISILCRDSLLYFKEKNGALIACSTLNSTQLTYMVGSGMRSRNLVMQTRYA